MTIFSRIRSWYLARREARRFTIRCQECGQKVNVKLNVGFCPHAPVADLIDGKLSPLPMAHGGIVMTRDVKDKQLSERKELQDLVATLRERAVRMGPQHAAWDAIIDAEQFLKQDDSTIRDAKPLIELLRSYTV